ncbi:MAG: hypothetical protein A2X36_03105 [Elusimicrobia bacterium GWA2_69_24]|nr:MAG: hypothetical protein A2X36_03105 [Elusimicrobia bacterium GWA2_69_24]HBL19223.1 hypothetical protein [Elusimicrobiota bacterium]
MIALDRFRGLLPPKMADMGQRMESTAFRVYVFVSSMSFRYKIAAALLAVLCLAIMSLGIVSFGQQKRVLQEQMQKRAEVLVRQVAGAGKTGLLMKDELGVFATIREVQKTAEVSYAIVLDSRGKVFAHSDATEQGESPAGPLDQAALAAQDLLFQRTELLDEPILDAALPIVSRLEGRDLRVGTARIGLSQKDLIAAIRRQRLSYFVITAVFCLLGLAISLALGNVLSRQIVILATAMKVVSDGDLNHTVQVNSNDDIGRLTQSFNDMVLKLREKLHMEKYLSQSTLQLIKRFRDTDHLSLGGERRHVAALFSDIRGFTAMTESLEPEEVVGLINLYLNLQAEVVYQREGTVDKFVGDEVMAIFTGDHAEDNSARAALDIQSYVFSLNAARQRTGKREIRLGIGLNAGDVIMGNMGSERQMDYTVIGDPVNVAARLCSAAAPGQVIMSHAVRTALGSRCRCQDLPELPVKGKKDPLKVYTLSEMAGSVRRHLRKKAALPASFTLAGLGDEKHPATIRDISEGGCVADITHPVGIGSMVDVAMDSPVLGLIGGIRCIVRHLRKVEGRYWVGLVFEALPDEARNQVSEFVHRVDNEIAAAPVLKNAQNVL